MNHRISKAVIDLAIANRVGTIKMEDLTGITKDTNDYFLKSWAYYQLQEFIEYKAKIAGIKILWVKPYNTSIKCPICGVIDKANRSKVDRTKFSCITMDCRDFGREKDADVVAAQNIAFTEGSILKGNGKEAKILKKKIKELALAENQQ